MLRTRPAATARRRRAAPAVAVLLLPLLAACGVGAGDDTLDDQSGVVAPSGLPVPLASGPRVGASGTANALTGEAVPDGRVLAVKIDNTDAALPQAGLNEADLVYVEEVEGGLTRLVALFQTEMPARIGPVRSARSSEVAILTNHGPVALAFAGANAGVLEELSATDLQLVSSGAGSEGFIRDPSRDGPYDVIGDGTSLLRRVPGSGVAQDVGLRFGPVGAGARPTSAGTYAWPASTVEFSWSDTDEAWVQQRDGEAAVDEEGEPVRADNVLFMDVPVLGTDYVDVNGAPSPRVSPVGTGTVTLLRDGVALTGSWARESEADPTSFTDAAGGDLLLDVGTTWVVLVPQGDTATLTGG
ncbi:DUF3048 domain-containing protein [Aquipuribacter sp. MA13-6]|uniref:DUF3048 domain-containing protein n=1 Tax=unclassified Aquipuribacter TaxID=2635084 RepID=UPI003EE8D426